MRWKVARALVKPQGPQWVTVVTFGAAILVGTLLLALPAAQATGKGGDWLASLFLATSATCVTGLSPVDITAHLSLPGQLVLLLLIQLGGLGIMTLGTFLFEVMGRRLSMSNEQVLISSLGFGVSGRVRSLLWRTVGFTVFWEVCGALVLGVRLYQAHGFSAPRAAYHGIFHAVSAFCNAGFALYPDGLIRYAEDPVILLTVAGLIIIGGVGFIVHNNLASVVPWRRNRLQRGRLVLHTRIVLLGTAVLLAAGMAGFLLSEWNAALAGLTPRARWVGAFFQSVTCRTAGFNAMDQTAMRGVSKALTMILMFIGGAPGSTAGGIKVSTAVVLVATVRAMIRNHEETEFGHRTVPTRAVRESIVITVLSLTLVAIISFVLNLTEAANRDLVPPAGLSAPLLFETISAFGTVGLSLGVTPQLSPQGLVCIIVCMFVGRLGPLTLALTMGGAGQGPTRRFPEENVVVG